MITGNAKALQVLYDGSVQLPFGVKGSTREGVTTNVGVQFRLCPRRRTCKPMSSWTTNRRFYLQEES